MLFVENWIIVCDEMRVLQVGGVLVVTWKTIKQLSVITQKATN
jgi:hypothetical protein